MCKNKDVDKVLQFCYCMILGFILCIVLTSYIKLLKVDNDQTCKKVYNLFLVAQLTKNKATINI